MRLFIGVIRIRNIIRNELVGSLTALLIFLILVLSSCTVGGSATSYNPALQNPFGTGTKNKAMNSEIASHLSTQKVTATQADYRVGTDDLLSIHVFQVEELDTKVRVSAQGHIGLPLIGKVEAGGLTVSELEASIANKYEKYLADPVVSVFIEEYRSQQIIVLGAVNSPKVYYVTGQVYLLDMLSMAGGLTSQAGDICSIHKRGSNADGNGDGEKLVIDLNELLISGRTDLNVPLSSGDVVHVPESGVFFIDGAVNSAGVYQIKGKTTLTQSVSMAKGAMYEANLSEVTILRDNGQPEREVIVANLKSIMDGKQADVLIEDKDIILVPKSGMKSFFKGFVTSMSFGVFRFGKGF
jgi:polysaccharide export outer membrane protein